jgi:hypothetical protein
MTAGQYVGVYILSITILPILVSILCRYIFYKIRKSTYTLHSSIYILDDNTTTSLFLNWIIGLMIIIVSVVVLGAVTGILGVW